MAVYLDNNATTALDSRVLDAMLPYLGQFPGNPSSVHRFGRLQKDAIETARAQVAALVGAQPDQVIFTSGGTESNNLLLQGLAKHLAGENRPQRIAVSAIEHMSMLEPARQLLRYGPQMGIAVDTIGVDTQGRVGVEHLAAALTEDTALVSVMSANNETGVIQDLAPLIEFAHEYGHERRLWFHSDACQAAGKIALDFNASGLHAMSLSAHKLYGPVGAGALVVDKRLPLEKIQYGGSQERNLRAGTENVAAIVGFGKAAELAQAELAQRAEHTGQLRDALQAGLEQIEVVTVFAAEAERLPNTLQFGVAQFDGETLLMQLDRQGIAVSSGSACTSGKSEPSHVLKAMAVDSALATSAIRVSFGKDNSMADVQRLISALTAIIENNQQSTVMTAGL